MTRIILLQIQVQKQLLSSKELLKRLLILKVGITCSELLMKNKLKLDLKILLNFQILSPQDFSPLDQAIKNSKMLSLWQVSLSKALYRSFSTLSPKEWRLNLENHPLTMQWNGKKSFLFQSEQDLLHLEDICKKRKF